MTAASDEVRRVVTSASPPSDSPAIDVRRVSKLFQGAVRALDGVSLQIRRNEFFTLLGPSGCGKTTLLRLIAGFEEPSEGAILLEGQDMSGLPPYRRLVNTVFQSYALFPHMSVEDNVAFGLRMRGTDAATTAARVSEALELVQLGAMRQRRPDQLSGGQQQRVALARALANRPKVLLLDEPLSALDYKLRKQMRLELKRLQRETGITFVFVTHDQEEALEMSDRIAVMSAGHVQQVGDPAGIYERPANRFVAEFIGESSFVEAEVLARTDAERCRCRLGNGAEVTAMGAAPPGTRVGLAIRPEHVVLARPDGADGALDGRVVEGVYQGATMAWHVEIPRVGVIVGRAAPDGGSAGFAPGDRVALRLAPDGPRVVEA